MSADLADLERRVTALERAQNDTTDTLRWVVAKLDRISAVQEEHTLRLERIELRLDRIDARLDGIDGQLAEIPRAIVETVRESEERLLAAIREERD